MIPRQLGLYYSHMWNLVLGELEDVMRLLRANLQGHEPSRIVVIARSSPEDQSNRSCSPEERYKWCYLFLSRLLSLADEISKKNRLVDGKRRFDGPPQTAWHHRLVLAQVIRLKLTQTGHRERGDTSSLSTLWGHRLRIQILRSSVPLSTCAMCIRHGDR